MGPETNTRFKSELKNLNFLSSLSRTVKSYFSEVQSNLNQITDIEENQKKSKDLKKEKNPNEQ